MPVLSYECFKMIKANNDIYAICKITSKSRYDPRYYFDEKEFVLQMKDKQIKYKYVEPNDMVISIPHDAVLVTEVKTKEGVKILGLDIEILKDVMTILGLLSGYSSKIKTLRNLRTLYTGFSVFAPEVENPIIVVSEMDRRYFSLVAPKVIEKFG